MAGTNPVIQGFLQPFVITQGYEGDTTPVGGPGKQKVVFAEQIDGGAIRAQVPMTLQKVG